MQRTVGSNTDEHGGDSKRVGSHCKKSSGKAAEEIRRVDSLFTETEVSLGTEKERGPVTPKNKRYIESFVKRRQRTEKKIRRGELRPYCDGLLGRSALLGEEGGRMGIKERTTIRGSQSREKGRKERKQRIQQLSARERMAWFQTKELRGTGVKFLRVGHP